MVLAHSEAFEFKLCLMDHIVRTKILSELSSEILVVRENWVGFPIQDHRLKPFQGKALEIRKNIIDLMYQI